MTKKASDLINDAQTQINKLPKQKPHPEDIDRVQIAVGLAIAQSNVELAVAITALIETASKQGDAVKTVIGGVASQLRDGANRR
ncbi:hypothetical protein AB0M68_37220 [Streptomyces sp. NPDC051453]|uniref:hypothetical protein n=1 Tax=Streptomyces sp. NPDC051453 TaxID=3154941 RepID=UPI00342C1C8B